MDQTPISILGFAYAFVRLASKLAVLADIYREEHYRQPKSRKAAVPDELPLPLSH